MENKTNGGEPALTPFRREIGRQRAGVCVGVLHSDVIPVPISVSP